MKSQDDDGDYKIVFLHSSDIHFEELSQQNDNSAKQLRQQCWVQQNQQSHQQNNDEFFRYVEIGNEERSSKEEIIENEDEEINESEDEEIIENKQQQLSESIQQEEQIQQNNENNGVMFEKNENNKEIQNNNYLNQFKIYQQNDELQSTDQNKNQQLAQMNIQGTSISLGESNFNFQLEEENVDDHYFGNENKISNQNVGTTEMITINQKIGKLSKKIPQNVITSQVNQQCQYQKPKKQRTQKLNIETKNMPGYYYRVIQNYVNKQRSSQQLQNQVKNCTIRSLRELLQDGDVKVLAKSYLTSYQFLDDLLTSEKQQDITPPIRYLNKIYTECIEPDTLYSWKD